MPNSPQENPIEVVRRQKPSASTAPARERKPKGSTEPKEQTERSRTPSASKKYPAAGNQASTKKRSGLLVRPTDSKTPKEPISQPLHRGINGQKQDNIIQLSLDLTAIATTTENRKDLISRLLDATMQRTRMLSATWITCTNSGTGEITDTRFSNQSLNNQVMRKVMVDAAKTASDQQAHQIIRPSEIRGTAVICIPMYQDDETTGVLCGLVHDNQTDCHETLLICELVATHFGLWRSRDQITKLSFEVRSAATVLELIGRTQCSETMKAAGVKIANEIQNLLRCDYVGVGFQKSEQAPVRLLAISSQAEFDNQSRTTMLMKSAFDEALMKGELTAYPSKKTKSTGTALAHKKLVGHMRCDAAISVPLRDQQNQLVGAITILGSHDLIGNAATQNLIHTLEHPVGTSLRAAKLIEGGVAKKIGRLFVSPEKTSTKWAVIAMLLIACISLFVPVSYRVNCKCTAEPVKRNYSVAPYEGLLENTFVQPGDVVKKGQLLAKMDGLEIRYKINGLVAERERAIRERASLRAADKVNDAIQAELKQRQLETELDVLRYRESNLEIRSTTDGIVLSGSFDQRQNFPVTIGQELYEIAPINPLRVELSIPADEIMQLEEGQGVSFRFEGFGTESHLGKLARIRPSSTIRDQANVFIAEVTLENSDGSVRPGMKGYGKIYGKRHTLGWTLFHLPWEKFVNAFGF